MALDTNRDKVWSEALELALDGWKVTPYMLADSFEISQRTAADVLKTMESKGWLNRERGDHNKAMYVPGPKLPKNLTSYKTENEEEADR